MVGQRGEAPLVPPYRFRRPNKAMALFRGAVTAEMEATGMITTRRVPSWRE